MWSSARVVNPRWGRLVSHGVCHSFPLDLSRAEQLCVDFRTKMEQSQFPNQSISITLSGPWSALTATADNICLLRSSVVSVDCFWSLCPILLVCPVSCSVFRRRFAWRTCVTSNWCFRTLRRRWLIGNSFRLFQLMRCNNGHSALAHILFHYWMSQLQVMHARRDYRTNCKYLDSFDGALDDVLRTEYDAAWNIHWVGFIWRPRPAAEHNMEQGLSTRTKCHAFTFTIGCSAQRPGRLRVCVSRSVGNWPATKTTVVDGPSSRSEKYAEFLHVEFVANGWKLEWVQISQLAFCVWNPKKRENVGRMEKN